MACEGRFALYASASQACAAFRSSSHQHLRRRKAETCRPPRRVFDDESDDEAPETLWDECQEDDAALSSSDAAGSLALLLLCREVDAASGGDNATKRNLLMAAKPPPRSSWAARPTSRLDLLATPSGLTGVAVEHVLLCGSGCVVGTNAGSSGFTRRRRRRRADRRFTRCAGGAREPRSRATGSCRAAPAGGRRPPREADADLADREHPLRKTRARIQSAVQRSNNDPALV